MTGRERVLAALNHREADMVPIDFGATRSSGINALAYYGLKEYLGVSGPVKVYDLKQLLADPDEEMLLRLQTDCAQLHRLSPSAGLRLDAWKKGVLMDGNPYEIPADFNPVTLSDGSDALQDGMGHVLLRRPAGGLYFDDVYAPLADASDKADIDALKLPSVSREELDFLGREAERLSGSEYAAVLSTGVSIFEKGFKDFGYEEYLVKIFSEPDLIEYYLERLTEAYLRMLDAYLGKAGGSVQVLQFNDDLGMQNSTILPPEVYRRVLKPYHKRIVQHGKQKAPHIFILLHCCGSIYDLIPDLIETGVDALNPVQINAEKMDPARLKREFGRDVTFWGGGCSTQSTLSFGDIGEITDEVKRMMEIFSPGGGFVFCPVHNIPANIPPEKIMAVYDTAIANRKR